MTLREAALRYATAGLQVFPCAVRGKAPMFAKDGGGSGYHDATADPAQVAAWWDANPEANIGLPCKPNGLAVVDVDTKDGGLDVFKDYRAGRKLPMTWVADTGGGGRHYCFQLPDDHLWGKLHNTETGEVFDNIDVKVNGYIVVGPSVHPSGNLYEWLAGMAPWDIELAAAPDWLLVGMVRPARAEPTPMPAAAQPATGERLTNTEICRVALPMLSAGRAEGYDSWIAVGQALHATDEALLPDYIAWSQQSQSFESADDCERHWRSFHPGGGLTVAALIAWVREDGHPDFLKSGWRSAANGHTDAPRAAGGVAGSAEAQPAPLRDVDDEEAPVSRRTQRHRALAAEFAEQHRDTWLTTEGRQWYRYTAGVWVARPTDEIRGMLWEFVDTRHTKPATLSIVNSVLDACATFPGWRVDDADLNAKPNLINVRNGVYDLDTGKLLPHSPALLQTVQRPFDYEPDACCPKWVEFLADVLVDEEDRPDIELMKVVQEWFGYVLTPSTAAQKAMVWPGEGSNGKGVATGIMISLVGKENMVATDIEKLDHEYNRAVLRDKLLAVSSEVPTGSLISDAPFKAIVAGDDIQGRYPHGRPFFFKPYSRFLITCNGMPATRDQTYAYFRRLIIVPWNHMVTPGETDPYLEDNLRDQELAGIFLWAVEGLRRLKAADWRFTAATAADRAMATYQLEGNSVAMWLNDRVEINPHALPETTARLFDDYREYCERFGMKLCGLPRFGRSIKAILGDAITKADRSDAKGWRGIELLEKEPGFYPRGRRGQSDE